MAKSKVILTTTLSGVKSASLKLENLVTENARLRLENPSSPSAWLSSEMSLFDHLSALSSSWGVLDPAMLPVVAQLGTWDTVVGLCTHANLDVAIAAMEVVGEMVGDSGSVAQGGELVLVKEFARNGGLEIVGKNLERVEGEENGGGIEGERCVGITLQVVMSVMEVARGTLGTEEEMEQVEGVVWDTVGMWKENQRSVAEVMAYVLTSLGLSTSASSSFVDDRDVEAYLVAFSGYMRREPEPGDEVEYVENLADCLCCLAKFAPVGFSVNEGVELCSRILCGRGHAGLGAMRVVATLVAGTGGAEEFADKGGIKIVGRIFMGRGKPKLKTGLKEGKKLKREKRNWERGIEEKAVEIVYLMTRYLKGGKEREYKERMVAKFLETECERCERVVEIMIREDERMREAEVKYLRSEEADEDEELGLDVEARAVGVKMEKGGATYFQASAIAGWICQNSKTGFGAVKEALSVRGSGMTLVKEGVKEWADMMEEGEEKTRLMGILGDIGA
ncbi:hypothetical protein TrRE_jg7305 [Triparma retinervis]|uniref:Beta-catenin-like protein 1 N-terminal domain-containing protein n=1 Tax=Triparma retinervis TaxID=2557542 RepID=A0A9W6ZQS3_9STRA|nr:hypothetical protein TrRE_jg7305 [Triparma retinervis]